MNKYTNSFGGFTYEVGDRYATVTPNHDSEGTYTVCTYPNYSAYSSGNGTWVIETDFASAEYSALSFVHYYN